MHHILVEVLTFEEAASAFPVAVHSLRAIEAEDPKRSLVVAYRREVLELAAD